MKVKEIMTSDVKSCTLDTNLAAAAKIMWEADCGSVPVTDDRGKVVGMITDRDICIAAATRPRTEGEIAVRDVISHDLYTSTPEEDVRNAMRTMKTQQVRRLPVVAQDGGLRGIVTIHDIAVQAGRDKGSAIPTQDVLETFIAITEPSHRRRAVPA
jgi:CBS domain-containing protein